MKLENTPPILNRKDIIEIYSLGSHHSKIMIYEGKINDEYAFLEDGYRINTLSSWRFKKINIDLEKKLGVVNFPESRLVIYEEGRKEFNDNYPLFLELKGALAKAK